MPLGPVDASEIWNGQEWLAAAPKPEMLTAELNRRLAAGFDYDFADQRGVHHFGTTDADMKRRMQEVTHLLKRQWPWASQAVRSASRPTRTNLRHRFEWWHVLDAAAEWRQPLYAAYFALKALPEIPADYAANPAYWP